WAMAGMARSMIATRPANRRFSIGASLGDWERLDQSWGYGEERRQSALPDNPHGCLEVEFFEIVTVAATVDHEVVAGLLQRRQNAVPGVHGDVDALPGGRPERAQPGGRASVIFGNDDQPGTV